MRTGEYRFPFLIVGVGLAVLAGLLWSPRAGKELRKELRSRDEGVNFMNGEPEKVRVDDRWFAKIGEYFGGAQARLRGRLGEQAN